MLPEVVNVALPVVLEVREVRCGFPDPEDPSKVGGYRSRWDWSLTCLGHRIGSSGGNGAHDSAREARSEGRRARAKWARDVRARHVRLT